MAGCGAERHVLFPARLGGCTGSRGLPVRIPVWAGHAHRPHLDGARAADRVTAGVQPCRCGRDLRYGFLHLATVQSRVQPGLDDVRGAACPAQCCDDNSHAARGRCGVHSSGRALSVGECRADRPVAAGCDGHRRAGGEHRSHDAVLPVRSPRRAQRSQACLCPVGFRIRAGGCARRTAVQRRTAVALCAVRGGDAGVRAELQQHRRCSHCRRAARADGQAVRIESRPARRASHRRARRAHPHRDPDAVPFRRVLLRAGRARSADSRPSRARARRRPPARAHEERERGTVRLDGGASRAVADRGLVARTAGVAPARGGDRQGNRLGDRGAVDRGRRGDGPAQRAAHGSRRVFAGRSASDATARRRRSRPRSRTRVHSKISRTIDCASRCG